MKRRMRSDNKASLRYKSMRRINEEHDKLILQSRIKDICFKKVKDNSQFKHLNELLPDEFEWIKTGKRLAQEAIEQKHCVASYDWKIARDKCAIYSFIYKDNKRYTVEFIKRKNEYALNQVFGKFNEFNQEAFDYVKGILKEVQKRN